MRLGKRQKQIVKEAATWRQGTTYGWSTGWSFREVEKLKHMGLLRYDVSCSGYFATDEGRKAIGANR